MSYVHEEPFTVRHYECDANGHVNHANYLRYMQEAAFGGSAAVGFDAFRYDALKLRWLAYETDVEYFKPLRYGDQFEVHTWVQDFRRVRSLRRYEIVRGGDLVARGQTDWVLIDMEKLAPTAIPPVVIEGYSAPGGMDPPPLPDRKPLLPPPAAPDGTFTMRRRVEWRDIDPAGHVNNSVYLNYVDDCAFQAHRHFGWSVQQMAEHDVLVCARRHFIEYKAMAMLDDEIEISTWMAHVRRSFAMRYFLLRRMRDNKVLARVRTHWAYASLSTGIPKRIPAEFLAGFAPNIAENKIKRG